MCYYKVRQVLQSETGITKCDRYYKVRQVYYKVRQVLQSETGIKSATGIIKWGKFITKWDRYYKVRQVYYKVKRLLPSWTVQRYLIR